MTMPFMPFYVGDYLRDTAHLSTSEHGAYVLLLFRGWTNGGCSARDDREAQRVTRLSDREWRQSVETLRAFFIPGTWRHKRIEIELQKAMEKSQAASNSATARWEKERQRKELAAAEAAAKAAAASAKASAKAGATGDASASANVSANAKPPQCYSESEPHSEKKKEDSSLRSEVPADPPKPHIPVPTPDLPPDPVGPAFAAYCRMALNANLPVPTNLSPKRRGAINARLKECGGLDGWREALRKIAASDFLCGRKAGSDYRVSFDSIVAPGMFAKLMEGSYDNHKSPGSNGTKQSPHAAELDAWAFAAGLDSGGDGGIDPAGPHAGPTLDLAGLPPIGSQAA